MDFMLKYMLNCDSSKAKNISEQCEEKSSEELAAGEESVYSKKNDNKNY